MKRWILTGLGVAVVASLSLLKPTIWQGRSGNQVTAEDIAWWMAALQERAYAVGGTPHVVTSMIPRWETGGDQYADHMQGSNVVYSNYLVCAGYDAIVRTNWYVNRQTDYWYQVKGAAIGRYVTAAGSQAVVSVNGFDSSVLNGVYGRTFPPKTVQVSWMVNIQIPDSAVLYWTNASAAIAMDDSGRWLVGPVLTAGSIYPWYATLDSARGLTAASWGRLHAFYTQHWYEPVTGVVVATVGTTNPIAAPAFEYAPANWSQGRQIVIADMADGDNLLKSLVPLYVDDTLATNGNFDLYFATPLITTDACGYVSTNYHTTLPMLTVTGLWARLGIGDRTNRFSREPARMVPAHTNWIYRYTDWAPSQAPVAQCYTSQISTSVDYAVSWTPTNGYVWSTYSDATPAVVPEATVPATYGDWPLQIYTNDLVERGRVVAALRWTPATLQWTNTVGYNWLDNAFTNVNWESNPEDWGAGQGDGYWLQISGWLPWWQATNGAFFLPAAGWNVAKINANLNSLSNGPPETSYARRWSYSKSQTYRSYVTDITWDGYPSAYELDSPQTQFSEMQANSNSYTVIYSVPAWTLPYWPTQIVCSAVCYAVCQTGLIDSVGSHQWSDGTITNVGSVVITHCGGPSNACADVVSIPDTIPPPTPGEIDTTAMGRSLFGGFGIVGHGVRYEADSRSGSTNEWTGTRYQSGQVLLKWQFQCLTNAP